MLGRQEAFLSLGTVGRKALSLHRIKPSKTVLKTKIWTRK